VDDAVAVVLFVAVTADAVLGGADFGAGFWDLVGGGAARGAGPRALVDHSIGPVWEANHVWLIFTLVVLWTAFPEAFASSSVLVPYGMGTAAGAIASGRGPAGGEAGDPWSSWINPTSVVDGVLAVSVGAYLAAVYLVVDARRLADEATVDCFRPRAIVAAGAVALVGIEGLRADARYVFDGVASRALPLVLLSSLCGIGPLVLIVRRSPRGARLLYVLDQRNLLPAEGVDALPPSCASAPGP